MEKHFILRDGWKYYVSEGQATHKIEDALKIKSIHELITTIPIMKDWNWDYSLYKVSGDNIKRIEDIVWVEEYWKWKDNNPVEWEGLYSASGISNFIRSTPGVPLGDINES